MKLKNQISGMWNILQRAHKKRLLTSMWAAFPRLLKKRVFERELWRPQNPRRVVATREAFLEAVREMMPENPSCIEVGVENGDFSSLIFNTLTPRVLHLIDPWMVGFDKHSRERYYTGKIKSLATAYSSQEQYNNVLTRFSDAIASKEIFIHRSFSYDAVDTFANDSFDFIYIDACHLYPSVRSDLSVFLRKVKTNGLLCGHDYIDFSNFGVIPAVNECMNEHHLDFLLYNRNGGDFALRRRVELSSAPTP